MRAARRRAPLSSEQQQMNTELARIVLLLVMFVGYVAICAWAFAPRNRARFEAAGRLALEPAKPEFEPVRLVSEPLASEKGESRR
jgi:cbb3-type cytochrome oxidase subunit 3